jgi:hypothetical protein
VNGCCRATSRRVQCHKRIVETGRTKKEERVMRTLGKIAATLGVIGAIAVGSVVPAAAWYGYGYGSHHRYYGYHHRYYAYYPRYHHRWWGGY